LALWGVDKIDAGMVTILGQIECTDAGRWAVQREFNRRMKKRFQELDIEIAAPPSMMVVQPLVPQRESTLPQVAAMSQPAHATDKREPLAASASAPP
jgi:small-conductance mechanosensitive channel